MDELEFIREYMAVMCCSEQAAVGVFIVHDALLEWPPILGSHEPAFPPAADADSILSATG
jgi:hypothetical protein